MSAQFIYLASASPRRRELLAQIGVQFEVLKLEVDESRLASEPPEAYVLRVARLKAAAGWQCRPPPAAAPVLAADTAVVLDGTLLGKPADRTDGERMLRALSGRVHTVLTAVAVATPQGMETRVCRSQVTLRAISAAEARAYWDTGEPRDKAGGYAIQGRAALFVSHLQGSFSGVMGLPLYETAELLLRAGVPTWAGAPA